ncbi:MAG: cytochrome c [Acidobacteriaceae bacterium]
MNVAGRVFLSCCFALTCSLLVCGCDSTPPPTPLADLNAQQIQGYQLFQSRCAECHHDRTTNALHGPGLRGMFKKQYLPSGAPANDERVTAEIVNGHGMMPPQAYLDEQERAALLAYLHTL